MLAIKLEAMECRTFKMHSNMRNRWIKTDAGAVMADKEIKRNPLPDSLIHTPNQMSFFFLK